LKEKTGVPLVIDFRDAWTLNPYSGNYLLKSLKDLNERFERHVFESADYIVTTSNGTREDYISKYPFVKSKMSTIYNGFDLDDFPEEKNIDSFDKFTIAYTGYFYGLRTPELLFSAFNKIFKNKLIPKDKFQFIWVGRDAPFVHKLIDKYDVQDVVKYEGFVSQKEAVEYLYKSHLLFLLSAPGDKWSIAAKTFEYIASGKPVLTLTQNKEVEELIKEYSHNSYVVTSQNTDEVVDAIVDAHNKWENGEIEGKTNIKMEGFRDQFNRGKLTRKMTAIFDEITSG
jgi:glycosyltransferase involved in cell wall biosynthesis